MSDDATHALEGTVVDGRYAIEEELGRGGMGSVFRATQVALSRTVALKVLRTDVEDDGTYAERMIREAKQTSSIRHQNVVEVIDFGTLGGDLPYIVMEFLEGQDLSDLLKHEGRLGWSRARGILLQVVAGLRAAHRKGVLHRDIKPSNCFLVEDRTGEPADYVKLLDFGIARSTSPQEQERRLTHHAFIVGTAKYLAPEVFDGAEASVSSDIYAVGVLAYKMLTGRPPFVGRDAWDLMNAARHESPRPMTQLARNITPGVERMVLRALAKKPEDRFRDTTELEAAILEIDAAGQRAASGRTGTVMHRGTGTRIAIPDAPAPLPAAGPGTAGASTADGETRPLTPHPGNAARAPTPASPSGAAWARPQTEAPRSSATLAIVLAIVVGSLVGAAFIVYARFEDAPKPVAETAPTSATVPPAKAAADPAPPAESAPPEPAPDAPAPDAPAPDAPASPAPTERSAEPPQVQDPAATSDAEPSAEPPDPSHDPVTDEAPAEAAASKSKPDKKRSKKGGKKSRDDSPQPATDASVRAQLKQTMRRQCASHATEPTTVQVRFTVSSGGEVSLVRVAAPHGAGALGTCLKKIVRTADFPDGKFRAQTLKLSL